MSDNAVSFIIPSRSRDNLYNSNVPMLIEINILKVATACFEGDSHGDCSNIGKAWHTTLHCLSHNVAKVKTTNKIVMAPRSR